MKLLKEEGSTNQRVFTPGTIKTFFCFVLFFKISEYSSKDRASISVNNQINWEQDHICGFIKLNSLNYSFQFSKHF